MNNKDWEKIPYEQLHTYTSLRQELNLSLSNVTDISNWQRKLAFINSSIPEYNADGSSSIFKGSATVNGVTWKWDVIKASYGTKKARNYVDAEGKVKEFQNDWSFLTLLTPVRTSAEQLRVHTFMKTYGDAFLSVLVRRCYGTLPNSTGRRG